MILDEEGSSPPLDYKHVKGRIIFDMMMDFTRKARWVVAGHKTFDLIRPAYAGVVSRESVIISFTYAVLNDLDVFVVDIQNAHLQAPCSKKHCITCGVEWNSKLLARKSKIVRTFYSLKYFGADFRTHLRDYMYHLGFQSCFINDDVWRRPVIKSNGGEYRENIMLYTDDYLFSSDLV